MTARTLSNFLLLLAVLYLPFWVFVVLVVVFVFIFRSFYEAVFWALFVDFLYGSQTTFFFGFQFISTFLVIIILVFAELFKKRLR